MVAEGNLPGCLRVSRRSAGIAAHRRERESVGDPDTAVERSPHYAIMVNELKPAGVRVVTATINGVAGLIPAVGYNAMTLCGLVEPADGGLLTPTENRATSAN